MSKDRLGRGLIDFDYIFRLKQDRLSGNLAGIADKKLIEELEIFHEQTVLRHLPVTISDISRRPFDMFYRVTSVEDLVTLLTDIRELEIVKPDEIGRLGRPAYRLNRLGMDASFALIHYAKADPEFANKINFRSQEGELPWLRWLSQTRKELGTSLIANVLATPDKLADQIESRNQIEAAPGVDRTSRPFLRQRKQRPDRKGSQPDVTRRDLKKVTVLDNQFGNQFLEDLKGWDVDRTTKLLSIILPDYDSVTGAQLPPAVEDLTRMVINMFYRREGRPLVNPEDLLTNNEARFAIERILLNLAQHPEIGNLANLYRKYMDKIANDWST